MMRQYHHNNDGKAPTPKWEKFQRRLISLSLDVDDKAKTIDLLIQAIREHEEESENRIKEQNAKYRVDFNETASQFEENLSKLVEEYSKATAKKKDMMLQIELLSEKKSQENELTKSRLRDVRKSIVDCIQAAFDDWDSSKLEREEKWLTEKVKHVRACTVSALQPEIKRLSQSHELEVTKLLEEATIRRRHLEKEMEIEFHRDNHQYLDEAEKRKIFLVESRAKKWRNDIRALEDCNQNQLNDIRTETTEILTKITDDDGDNSEEAKYREELCHLNDELHSKMKDLQDNQAKQVQKINDDLKQSMEEVKDQMTRKQQEWETNARLQLQTKMNEQVKSTTDSVRIKRDEDIDVLIRLNHEAEEQLEIESLQRRKQESNLTAESLAEKIKHVVDKNDMVRTRLLSASKQIEQINVEGQQILEQIQTKELLISKTEHGLLALKTAYDKMVFTASNSRESSNYEAIKDLETKQSELEKQMQELSTTINSFDSNKKTELDKINNEHMNRLMEKEKKFLVDMKKHERVMEVTKNDIKRMKIQLEKQRDMVMKAYASQPVQLHVASKLRNTLKPQNKLKN